MAEYTDARALYESLEKKIQTLYPELDVARIRKAFEIAHAAHGDQKRRDGSPYISHPICVADIVVDLGLDEDSIIAAILHDGIEDTAMTYDDVAKQFGTSVADIVEGVTKLTRVQYTSKEDEQMENLRKMLMAMAKDIRVILIKIADRLHNMRTMEYQTEEKQRLKSLETMEIYAPIAHRLGMQRVKWELEDLSLLYLDPIGYEEITGILKSRQANYGGFMKDIEQRIVSRLAEYGIKAKVYGRLKHIYSIYRKMYSQRRNIDEIFDLCAFRVIVDDIADCYNVLGHVHDMFKPIPGRFKDYIGTPKPNMYQSLHTTVIGSEGIPFEVQIRTWEMHHTAEYGIAAHWKYKAADQGVRDGDEEKFAWVRRLLETQQDTDASDFVHDLKIDMFADEVFVFTPQGDVINLPAGATPIDFAYSIHSAIGNRMIGAKVNGRIVQFSHVLENGDIVDIVTSKAAPGPSRDWLSIAKSGSARTKIRQWLKKEKREENILRGREMFEAELKRAGVSMSDVTNEEMLPLILKKVAVVSLDDMFSAIGYGGMTATRAVNRIKDEVLRAQKNNSQKTALDKLNEAVEKRTGKATKAIQGVLVEGLDNCLIKFSRCCTPVPGDEIVGFITKGYGVSVHRKDCENYTNRDVNGEDAGRWINVSWAPDPGALYTTSIRVLAREKSGLILDIATALATCNAKVRGLTARDVGGGKSFAALTLEVEDLQTLKTIMAKLSVLPGVTGVVRGAEQHAELKKGK